MYPFRRKRWLGAAGLGLTVLAPLGCQTYIPSASLTLPSPHYLEHPPQFIQPDPDFPLPRELATQDAYNQAAAAAAAAGVAPGGVAPVPAGPVMPAPVGAGGGLLPPGGPPAGPAGAPR
jgi:hypothetical protein